MDADYYKLLGIRRTANFGAIKHAYEQLKRQSLGDPQVLQILEEAYRTLSNPITRAAYDKRPSEAPVSSNHQTTPKTTPTDKPASSAGRVITEAIDISKLDPTNQSITNKTQRPHTTVIDVGEIKDQSTQQNNDPKGLVPPESPSVPAPEHQRLKTESIQISPRIRTETIVTAQEETEQEIAGELLTGACQIIITSSQSDPEPYNIGKDGLYTIGRPSKSGPEPDIKLKDRYVSREHATLTYQDGILVVIDKGSRNGTRLNGQRLAPDQPHPLREHDRLEIEAYSLLFRIEGNAKL